MPKTTKRVLATAVVAALASAAVPAATAAAATTTSATSASSSSDAFYSYDGSKPLSSYAPGAVLKRRTLTYHILGVPTPLKAIQLLYRTTDAQGRPAANVTTVVRSITGDGSKAVSYQSFYDSLNPEDGPSRAIAGDVRIGGLMANTENLFLMPLVLQGYTVVIPDTEGQKADFAAGPEYAKNTLDSIRAASDPAADTGMTTDTRVGLLGYSGGAIATNWASALAPSYAPDVNRRLVGFAEGGLLVDPAHNLKYVDGSLVWSGVIPMAVIGVARSYGIDLKPYLNDYGLKVYNELEHGSLLDALGHYPGLTWKKLTKPEYSDPDSIPEFVEAVNKVNLGSAPTPTIPGFVAEGNGGVFEGTFGNPPGIGRGDGVMVSGDVRALARQYCADDKAPLKYHQYDLLSHIGTAAAWAPQALAYLGDRFTPKPAPTSCGSIPPGNDLTPEQPTDPS